MKTFEVTKEAYCRVFWTYYVEAATEEEAIALVEADKAGDWESSELCEEDHMGITVESNGEID